MSTSNSVGRLTATNEKVRLTATSEKVRLTATQENGRSTATFKVGRLTATNKKDRSRLCAFTFADGPSAALRAAQATSISATTTLRRKPKPSSQNKPVRI